MKFLRVLLFSTTIVLLGLVATSAAPISKTELTRLGMAAFLQRFPSSNNAEVVLKSVQFYGEDELNPLLAILNFNQGYIVMAGDNAAYPVLAYSFTSNFECASAAPAALAWIDTYQKEILQLRRDGAEPVEEIIKDWASLENTSPKQDRSIIVSPLITAKWNQTKYYNRYSPLEPESPSGYDNRTPNGCVAVAMSMIMYYYRYPEHGYGSHTNHSTYGDFSVDFAQQHYNYDVMQDELSYYNNEVAKLIFHCATSVDMMYGADGSGAYSDNVPDAVKQYFGYSNSCNLKRKNYYNGSQWRQMLKNELDAGRPIYYSGYSDEGGHAFVCDGYDSDNMFHFNFGWGGVTNGFFALSSSASQSNPVGGYSGGQAAVFDFYPNDNNYPYFCDSKVITSSSGTLEDGSNTMDYQNNSHCTYVITEDDAYRISVHIDYLDTELDHDTLSFWNGNPQNGQLLLTLSGSTPDITSYTFFTDSLYITFDTDEQNTANGWRLSFSVDRNTTSCHPEVINGQYSGTITDGSGSGYYGNNMNCMWRIRVMDRERITFTFTEFGISPEDELRFYNLKIQPKEMLASYSGTSIPEPVTLESNYVEVLFVTDNCLNDVGFTANWTTEENNAVDVRQMELLSLYPNPANENVNIQLPYVQNWTVSVLDFSGREIYTDEINSDRFRLSVDNFSNGIFFVVCKENDKVLRQKFVVRH